MNWWSTGAGEAEKIRAGSRKKQRRSDLAEAYRDRAKIKGEGDAAATKIYAAAYGKNASSIPSIAAKPTATACATGPT